VSDYSDVVTIGETMALLRVSESGPVELGSSFELGFGGAESNVAIGLCRLGVSSTWLSALGRDAFGSIIRHSIESEGVRVIAPIDPVRPTGLMIKAQQAKGDPSVRYHRTGSAASAVELTPVVEEAILKARWIHLTGILPALSDSSRDTVLEIVDLAVNQGIPFSFDVNYRGQLWSKEAARSTLLGIVSEASIVFGGKEELEMLVGEYLSTEDLMKAVSDCGPPEVVAKLGAGGAMCSLSSQVWSSPAHPVTVVDTVGAGDAFVAGYLSQRLANESPERSLLRGVICGAMACTQPGDWEGAPTRDEVIVLEKGVLV